MTFQAVGPGKQLPGKLLPHTPIVNENVESNETRPLSTRDAPTTGKQLTMSVGKLLPHTPIINENVDSNKARPWSMRDASIILLSQRQRKNSNASNQKQRTIYLSSNFSNLDLALNRIQSDKQSIVRQSFDAAATAVLQAIRKSNEKKLEDLDNEDEYLKYLPSCLQNYKKLEDLRAISLDRSHDNKEYVRRKGGKTETPLISDKSSKKVEIKPTISKPNVVKSSSSTVENVFEKKSLNKIDKNSTSSKSTSNVLKIKSNSDPKPVKSRQDTSLTAILEKGGTSSTGMVVSSAPVIAPPKFTRNTPASSAAALDSRFNSSRAILCVAGNIAFEALTPSFGEGHQPLDALAVPQNPSNTSDISKSKKKTKKRKYSNASSRSTVSEDDVDEDSDSDSDTNEKEGSDSNDEEGNKDEAGTTLKSESKPIPSSVNMGAVSVEAQMVAQRTICVVENAMRRASLRFKYRKDNARYSYGSDDEDDRHFLNIANPYAWKPPIVSDTVIKDKNNQTSMKISNKGKKKVTLLSIDDENEDTSSEDEAAYNASDVMMKSFSDSEENDEHDSLSAVPYHPNSDSNTYFWQSVCLPRFLSVLSTGAGHAIFHDIQWSSRHGRIADLLRALTNVNENFGPHLIVTTEPELDKFGHEFYDIQTHLRLVTTTNEVKSLHTLTYHGSTKRRTQLRSFFPQATGLPEAPFHVLLTTYATFFEDYIHFCQLPFETVILDEGVSFMAACDQNSAMGGIWDAALFTSNDQHVGLGGTSFKEWDFSRNNEFSEAILKDALIGLTSRHRIMTASTFTLNQRQVVEYVPVSGLVDFVAPQFATVAKEEWARSRIAFDAPSMEHFRKLIARSMIIHSTNSSVTDMYTLALQSLTGKLETPDRSGDPQVPDLISDDEFVSSSKVAFSRRSSLLWLGPPNQSWLRYELGITDFQPIMDAMKLSSFHGHFCEEITTASSTTTSGANGQVAGTMAFRCGVRCGRHFGSEQGLRQHVSALHAPPGTWLCRTCGSDCVTSQARTHHERSCGQPCTTNGEQGGNVGATPTVGQGSNAKGGVGKKKATGRPGVAQPGAAVTEEKDLDGSFRIPGYRGVWVNKSGKHFVKIEGKRLTDNRKEDGKLLLFDNIDDAARMHDKIVNKGNQNEKVELNFKSSGSRIIYEDITPASTSGLGGSAANVVPALSVINIKDLPPDVKPLLRDPRQTSRTGGNSKRHVYAYRGVCRQARKGHDRWQSQISFMGVNHYLGTFDSEWDAAAIYAWAHLILYGEEATRQAQKEGEEAAAAYEQEKRDIAAGKIPEPLPKQDKNKKKVVKKGNDEKEKKSVATVSKIGKPETPKKRKIVPKESANPEKKSKPITKTTKTEKETHPIVQSKGVSKCQILAPRDVFERKTDAELSSMAASRLIAARKAFYCASIPSKAPSSAIEEFRPCIPIPSGMSIGPIGGAMLLGLTPSFYGWDLQDFVESNDIPSEQDKMEALQLLAVEYDDDGINEKFKCIMQGTVCIIGCASQKMYEELGLGKVPIGGVCGRTDCHIGGVPGSCSETSACIRYEPTDISDFQFSCLSSDDIVTLNGQRIIPDIGSFPLFNEDICTVGARVFTFLLPTAKS